MKINKFCFLLPWPPKPSSISGFASLREPRHLPPFSSQHQPHPPAPPLTWPSSTFRKPRASRPNRRRTTSRSAQTRSFLRKTRRRVDGHHQSTLCASRQTLLRRHARRVLWHCSHLHRRRLRYTLQPFRLPRRSQHPKSLSRRLGRKPRLRLTRTARRRSSGHSLSNGSAK